MRRRTSKASTTEAPEDLSRQLLNAQEEERRRISRELHDETGQGLMVLRFQLEMLASDAKGQEDKAKIQESLELLDRTIEGLRRTIARLSPRVLEELGLLAGIRREAQVVSRHMGIEGDLQLPEEIQPLSRELEVAIYRSVQEAIKPQIKEDFDWLISLHLLLRRHGQEICKRTKPLCEKCPLTKGCRFFAENRNQDK